MSKYVRIKEITTTNQARSLLSNRVVKITTEEEELLFAGGYISVIVNEQSPFSLGVTKVDLFMEDIDWDITNSDRIFIKFYDREKFIDEFFEEIGETPINIHLFGMVAEGYSGEIYSIKKSDMLKDSFILNDYEISKNWVITHYVDFLFDEFDKSMDNLKNNFNNKKVKIYVASSFFSDPVFMWTEWLAKELREEFGDKVELYVPQENDEINDKENGGSDIDIYEADIQDHLLTSDILIANVDGVEIDAGVAGEILSASTHNELEDKTIKIIGLTTDMRYGAEGDDHFYINKMVVGAVKKWGTFITGKPHNREGYLKQIKNEVKQILLDY